MFVHLRVHSEYSLIDGTVRIKPLLEATRANGQPAVALTDVHNLFGLVKFYKAALGVGVQPIVGADFYLGHGDGVSPPPRLTLIAQNAVGYRHLTELLTRSWVEGQDKSGRASIDADWLDGASDGLIALSGGVDGIFVGVGRVPDALDESQMQPWLRRFPDRFYLELIRTGRAHEEDWIACAIDAAERFDLPVVATNDVRFLAAEDFDAHEARVCIHDGHVLDDPKRPRRYSEQQYLRSPDEMAALFADIPEALANTVEIARRCAVHLTLGTSVLPEFPVPDGAPVDVHLRRMAEAGLDERFSRFDQAPDAEARARYRERLERELGVIIQMGFPGYFLIVADFIQWAKGEGIPVGPGRGSGAGSVVAWALKITDLDPLKYDLLFERFLNPERVSMPDFDIDFCMERRDDVIDYVARRYGRDRVSQIITHGTMAAKAVVRDVGRVLGHGYGFVDKVAKLIPFELGITLEKALQDSPELAERVEQDEEVRAIIELGLKLEGLVRNAGKHAGGVVIAPSALTDFAPLYCEPGGGSTVTQFDKDDVEAVGLVKFDFLGLRTLTILDWALENVRSVGGDVPDIERLELNDSATFALLQSARTTAVFQLESTGMKELIRRLKPDQFEDIVALVALYRPGPLQSGMVDDFIDRKHGRAKVEYPHPDLGPILRPTYGVILYQEQVMQIAQVLAGYSLGGADLLRRAMGKKKPEEMAKQREIFTSGALARGVDESTATYIFDLMEKFAGYGFNKSHSAAYALVSYQTAWMKAHHPAAFMAAVLSADMDNTDKVVALIDECRAMGLTIRPPGVNHSVYRFACTQDREIVYGLGAIKGVGESAIQSVLSARNDGGRFVDLADFCARVDLSRVNRRVLVTLIKAGAFDELGANRATLMEGLDGILSAAEQTARNAAMGVVDLFGEPSRAIAGELAWCDEYDEAERLALEKEALGLYLTGHPIAAERDDLKRLTGHSLGDLAERLAGLSNSVARGGQNNGGRERRGRRGEPAFIAGLVVGVRARNTQSGRMLIVTLDDQSGRAEVVVFNDDVQRFATVMQPDELVVVEGLATADEQTGVRLRGRSVWSLDDARALAAVGVRLHRRVGYEMSEPAIDTSRCDPNDGGEGGAFPLIDPKQGGLDTRDDFAALLNVLEAWPEGSLRAVVELDFGVAKTRLSSAKRLFSMDMSAIRRAREAGWQVALVYSSQRLETSIQDDARPGAVSVTNPSARERLGCSPEEESVGGVGSALAAARVAEQDARHAEWLEAAFALRNLDSETGSEGGRRTVH